MPVYPGSAKATIINANTQVFLFNNERTGPGSPINKASIACQLERQKSASYPFGFAVEIAFSGAPGTFEADVQGAETDADANYCNLGTPITAVNAGNVGRFEGVAVYPKFVRVLVKTLTNDVNTTVVLTR